MTPCRRFPLPLCMAYTPANPPFWLGAASSACLHPCVASRAIIVFLVPNSRWSCMAVMMPYLCSNSKISSCNTFALAFARCSPCPVGRLLRCLTSRSLCHRLHSLFLHPYLCSLPRQTPLCLHICLSVVPLPLCRSGMKLSLHLHLFLCLQQRRPLHRRAALSIPTMTLTPWTLCLPHRQTPGRLTLSLVRTLLCLRRTLLRPNFSSTTIEAMSFTLPYLRIPVSCPRLASVWMAACSISALPVDPGLSSFPLRLWLIIARLVHSPACVLPVLGNLRLAPFDASRDAASK